LDHSHSFINDNGKALMSHTFTFSRKQNTVRNAVGNFRLLRRLSFLLPTKRFCFQHLSGYPIGARS